MAESRIIANNGSSIVLYTTDDGNTRLEVKLEKDTVWLNREQIAQLYGRDYKTIAKHINNALKEELEGEPVVAKFATTTCPSNSSRLAFAICFPIVFTSLSNNSAICVRFNHTVSVMIF